MVIIQGVIKALIAPFIIWCISLGYKKYNKIKKNKMFTVENQEITQKANVPCITVKFKSKNDMIKFQELKGKLVGNKDLIGWVHSECPLLNEYMSTWSYKIKKILHLKDN